MEYKLTESGKTSTEKTFYFVGFDDWEDFVKIMKLVEEKIKPNESNYKGITDMNGYFKKDGITVEVEYSSMVGNCMIFKGTQTDANIEKVRLWAITIIENLKGSRNAI